MGMVMGKINEEMPAFTVLHKAVSYEVRKYGPSVVAECSYDWEASDGGSPFGVLARYIGVFGTAQNEQKGASVPILMTAPVLVTPPASQKIAMTAPVLVTPSRSRQLVESGPACWPKPTAPSSGSVARLGDPPSPAREPSPTRHVQRRAADAQEAACAASCAAEAVAVSCRLRTMGRHHGHAAPWVYITISSS